MTRRLIISHIVTALFASLLIGFTFQLALAEGYVFTEIPIPSMNIISPPYPPNRYENSTVNFEVNVYLFSESPKVNSIDYSVDGEPLQYIKNLTTTSPSNFGSGRVGYTVIGKAVLENLTDGNHTINANANGMHTSRDFTVNSSYQVASIKILSPTNQTYNGEIPLIFTVNGNIEKAYYYLYEQVDYPHYGPDKSNEYPLAGNTTITLNSEGKYEILIIVVNESGRAEAVTTFTVTTNFSTYYLVAIGSSKEKQKIS
jgi:hypothetical protein